jgi:tetratricopeptide (TPR) repeat protein
VVVEGPVTHPSPRCVVELRTTRADGSPGVGSGYLVAEGWVLTAAHVVAGASSVRAWVNPKGLLTAQDELPVDTAGIVQFPNADWALVPVPSHRPPAGFAPVVFGSLDRESADPVQVVALGLPWFRLRDRPENFDGAAEGSALVREVVAAGGQVIPAGGGKTGVLTMTVVGAPDTANPTASDDDKAKPDKARSVWEGMSGAAVWAGALLVGVVVRHELREGAAALTVHSAPEGAQDMARGWPDRVAAFGDLVPVRSAPAEVGETYRRTAARLAPVLLSGRADEITALEAFAAGQDRWWWWSASAFAGKTALTAWWVACRSEPQVAVVACFLRRTASQNTAEHVIRAWAEQLGALAGLPAVELHQLRSLAPDAAGITRLRELVKDAARHCPRLVLVVDGLDEYTPTPTVPVGEWLPDAESLPAGAGLLVTSRTGAPHGIPTGHPLHQHIHRLDPSPVAAKIRELAEAEIKTALQDPTRLDNRILGFLAAANGPLTSLGLAVLIQRAGAIADPSDIDTIWERHLARTLTRDSGTAGVGIGGYAFSHDALRDSARHRFAADLPSRREVLRRWAAEYSTQGWPPDTPGYLLYSYPTMLAEQWRLDQSQLGRLVELVTDPARHDRLRAVTGGDAAALAELTMAVQLLTTDPAHPEQLIDWRPGTCSHPNPSLDVLAAVVWHRDRLHDRNRAIPTNLPAVWVSLGQLTRAENLANGIPEPSFRRSALAKVAEASAQAGLYPEAERVAGAIDDPRDRAWALASVAEVLAQAGHYPEAERVAGAIDDPRSRAWTLVEIAEVLAQAGHYPEAERVAGEAEQLAGSIDRAWPRARALAEIAEVLAQAGQYREAERVAGEAERVAGEAERVADGIDDPWSRAVALASVAVALTSVAETHAKAGRDPETERVAGEAERVAGSIDDSWSRAVALASVAEAHAKAGRDPEAERVAGEAEQVAGGIDDPESRAKALAGVAEAHAKAGQDADAERVAGRAERVADGIDDPRPRARALASVAEVLARAGKYREAERVAGGIDDAESRAEALTLVAEAHAKDGQDPQAERVAREAERVADGIDNPWSRAEALTKIAEVLAQAGQYREAERVADGIDNPESRAKALAGVAGLLTQAGQDVEAERVAGEAERVAGAIDHHSRGARALASFAKVLARAGQYREAERVAGGIDHAMSRAEALASFAEVLARAGQYREAERVAGGIDDAASRAGALTSVAEAHAKAGQDAEAERVAGEAERVASGIDDAWSRAWALASVAEGLARAGHYSEAERVAGGIDNPWSRAEALAEVAEVLARAGQDPEAERVAGEAERVAGGIDDPESRAKALATVAEAHAKARQDAEAERVAGEAERVADGIDDPGGRAWALASLAMVLARAGQYSEAERIAGGIDDPRPRARVLASVAEAQVKAGEIARAAQLIAAVWTLSSWDTPLQALALMRSPAFITLTDVEINVKADRTY